MTSKHAQEIVIFSTFEFMAENQKSDIGWLQAAWIIFSVVIKKERNAIKWFFVRGRNQFLQFVYANKDEWNLLCTGKFSSWLSADATSSFHPFKLVNRQEGDDSF